MDTKFKRIFTVFYALKVFCALLMSLLVIYYWGLSDNTLYFAEGKNLLRLISRDFSNIKYFFLPVESYNEKIKIDNELTATISSIGSEGNFFAAKVSAILYPISFGSYLVINFFFSVIAGVGLFQLFIVLCQRYPHIKKNVAVAVLLMPSVILYSSYLNKESLCLGFMGFAFYHFFQVINKKKRGLNLLLLLLNIFFIGLIKGYIVAAFLAAALLFFIIRWVSEFWHKSIFTKIIVAVSLICSSWLFFSNLPFFDPYIIELAEQSNTFQQTYSSQDETSSFEFGQIETSFSGVLQKVPLGIYTTYFRPQLWEVNKPIILFSALESFFVFILTFWAIIARRKYIRPLFRDDFFAGISFYYVLIFGVIVGLSTFNFGSLVRYKIPAVPFLMMFVFLLLHYRPQKNGEIEKIITKPA